MIIDTHAHLNDKKLNDRKDDIIKNFKKENILKVINPSASKKDNLEVYALAQEHKRVYCALGVHPNHVDDYTIDLENLIIDLSKNKKVVAIGEFGLDYHWNKENKNKQMQIMVRQLELANKVGLPVIIHMRDSYGDTLNILKNHKHLLNNSGVVHCFSGSLEFAKEVIDLGLYVSFGGIITFKNSSIKEKIVKEIDVNRILVETDSPYLAPHPYRGNINEPKYISYVVRELAELFSMPIRKMEKKLNSNAYVAFPKLKNK